MSEVQWEAFREHLSDYLGLEKEEIKKTTNLYEELGVDSLGIFSLGMYLCNTYKVQPPLSALAPVQTAYDLFELICNFS